jgi:hypothetical protein
MLRYPDRHPVVREIISNKPFEVADVLNGPNGGAWHLKNTIHPLRMSNSDLSLLISCTNTHRFPPLDVS